MLFFTKRPKSGWIYILDSREEDDPGRHSLGDPEKQTSSYMEKTLKGQSVTSEYRTSSSGATVSRYLLLRDSQGKALAIMRGDFDAGEMTDFLYTTRYVQIGVTMVALLLIGGIVIIGSQGIRAKGQLDDKSSK